MIPLPRDASGIVARALAEDVGAGDVTTTALVPAGSTVRAVFVTREEVVVAGGPLLIEVFGQLSPQVTVQICATEGQRLGSNEPICRVEGDARAILTGERVALNFLQRLCGIATLTANMVESVLEFDVRIVDTRKTTPGLRSLEKYAVKVGGGYNHRMGLYDAVVIKDNHIAAVGSIATAVARAREHAPHTMTVTVECDTSAQVDEALEAGADILLLDNMSPELLAEMVTRIGGRAVAEASGGVTPATVRAIAEAGVDIISVGALTHSARAVDIGLDFEE